MGRQTNQATQTKTVAAEFLQERETKRTIRFREIDNGSGEEITGILYIKKEALRKLDYNPEQILVVTLSVKEAN